MIKTILVPLDGSSFGEFALPPAFGVARRADAALCLASVHRPVTGPVPARAAPTLIDPMPDVPVPDPRQDAESRAHRRSYLESVARRVAVEPGVHVTTALLDGPVADALVSYAGEIGADLVVMTTHGHAGFSRLWLGSVAEAVVREATAPVLLVRPAEAPGGWSAGAINPRDFRRVLVTLDGSSLAEAVLEPALDVASENAEWALVRVVEPITAISVASLGGVATTRPEDWDRQVGDVGDYLESVAASLRARGLTVRARAIVHTQAARAILDYASEIEADLIAMVAHGRSGLRRLLMGSVADKVLRGAESAVLLYRPSTE